MYQLEKMPFMWFFIRSFIQAIPGFCSISWSQIFWLVLCRWVTN